MNAVRLALFFKLHHTLPLPSVFLILLQLKASWLIWVKPWKLCKLFSLCKTRGRITKPPRWCHCLRLTSRSCQIKDIVLVFSRLSALIDSSLARVAQVLDWVMNLLHIMLRTQPLSWPHFRSRQTEMQSTWQCNVHGWWTSASQWSCRWL